MHLNELGRIELPHGDAPGYDHGDVHDPTGRVFVANTELGQLEVLDGVALTHVATIRDCLEASGVLVAEDWVFGAARGSGELLVVSAVTGSLVHRFAVGTAPNGLAWDSSRRCIFVADVADLRARIFDLEGGLAAERALSGRPRWCEYVAERDAFLVNVREPAVVELLCAENLSLLQTYSISAQGPHGLGRDSKTDTALIACDDATLQWLDLGTGSIIESSRLSGGPDVLWVDTLRRTAYVSVGDPGTVHVFDLDTRTETMRISTGLGAHTSALDQRRGRLFVFLPDQGEVIVYEIPTRL